MMIRALERHEIEKIWTINRAEVIDNIYYLEDGKLILRSEHYDMQGWLPGAPERNTPSLVDCFDRGGTFFGAFEGEELIGAAILENEFIGHAGDQLQLVFLHVSQNYRKTGLGRRLFEKAVERARQLGAKRLYVSATPSENTVNFYLHLGCTVTDEVDPELFEEEPDDIHLEYAIPAMATGDERE